MENEKDTAVLTQAPEDPSAGEAGPENETVVPEETDGKKKKERKPILKGCVKAIDPKMILILFGLFTVVMAILRSYQMMYLFEPDTGFYFREVKNSITVPVLYTIAGVSAVIYLLLSRLSAKIPEGRPLQGRNYFFGVSAVIFAVSLVSTAMVHFSELIDRYEEKDWGTLKLFMNETQSMPKVAESVCALLGALYLIVLAVSYFSGKEGYKGVRILSIFPVGFYVFRLVSRFIKAQSFIAVSELFWELIAATCLMIFFLEFARIMADAEGKDKLHFAYGVGLCGASVSLMIFISRVAVYLFAGSAYLTDEAPIEFCDLGAAIFVFVFLLSYAVNLRVKETPKEIVVDAPAPQAAPAPAQEDPAAAARYLDEEAFRIADEYSNRYISDDQKES